MERISRFRAFTLLGIFAAILGIYSVRMYSMQILGTGDVVENSSTYTSYYTVKAARGDILDRNGNVLVSNEATYNLVFNNFVLMNSSDANGNLLKLVNLCKDQGIEYVEHFPISQTKPYTYTLDQQSTTWQGYFKEYLSYMEIDSDISAPRLIEKLRTYCKIPENWSDADARAVLGLRYELALRADITNLPSYIFIENVDDETLNAISELNIPGLDAEVSTRRVYNTKYAAHILGTMGQIDAETWPEYKKKGYSMDAYVGTSGFEKAFEDELRGTDGQIARTVDQDGNIVSEYYTKYPVAGNNVETTIDLNYQMIAEDSMAELFQRMRDQGGIYKDGGLGADVEGGAVVVTDVNTGAILACASYPTYDPALFNVNYNEILKQDFNPLINRALELPEPPGSIFKMAMATAALENGIISRYTEIEDLGVYTKYDGLSPMCLVYARRGTTHGVINVEEALRDSCNYFFYEVGDEMPIEMSDAFVKAYGLGEPTGVELPEEIGHRANPETKAKLYDGIDSNWFAGDQVLAAIGQSDHRFTPMQMASYTATIANGGTRHACTFLSRIVSADYSELVRENTPKVLSTVPMSPDTYDAVVEGMRKVVTEGTASGYFWGYDTVDVCAKTGTAEHGSGGSANGSFVCFAPMENPEIAIAVYGEKGGEGGNLSQIAMPIMDAYFSEGDASDVVTYENRLG